MLAFLRSRFPGSYGTALVIMAATLRALRGTFVDDDSRWREQPLTNFSQGARN